MAKLASKAKETRLRLKLEVISHYSNGQNKCSFCGEKRIECLQIDHVNGQGNQHRTRVIQGRNFYTWLKQNNYPEGFQVLCANCNWYKYFHT
jgi:hypothetical protein